MALMSVFAALRPKVVRFSLTTDVILGSKDIILRVKRCYFMTPKQPLS